MTRRRDERGVVGGSDGLVFGMLILVAGSVLILNAWAVLDTRASLDAAAREYLRSYTEQTDGDRARDAGELAAHEVLRLRGTRPDRVTIVHPDPNRFGPCAAAEVRLSTTVDWIRVPFIRSLGDTVVQVVHSELIDAHREVMASAGHDPLLTACAQQ